MDVGGTSNAAATHALERDLGEGAVPLRARLTTEIVRDLGGIRALRPEYECLYQATGNTLPFALLEWHLTWCRHFLNRNPQIREQPIFHVLRTGAGDCIAIVPLILVHRRIGPLRFATAELIGADPGLTEIRNPLVRSGYEWPVVHAVHESLARIGGWDWIQWSRISRALADAVALDVSPRWDAVSDDYVLDLPSSWAEFRAGLKRNIRESLRHCYNSLKCDGHAFELRVAREPEEVRRALDRFLQLHALRSNMASASRHPNWFARRSAQAFLYDVCNSLAARGGVRVFQLAIGAEVVASRIGFVVGSSIYMYYSGYDPKWARYSVMTTTLAEALKYAIANGYTTVNLSVTAEQSKLRWGPRRVDLHSALVERERLSSRLLCSVYRAARSQTSARAERVKRLLWAARGHN